MRLIPFHISTILGLFKCFEAVCVMLDRSKADIQSLIDVLTANCVEILDQLNLTQSEYIHATSYTTWDPPHLWRCAVHVLEFALLSYAGAHLEAFDEKYLRGKKLSFIVSGYMGPQSRSPLSIVLHRRRLQCLDEFLGGQDVWVFHLASSTSCFPEGTRLLLSTDISTLADVWGPMWMVKCSSNEQIIDRYNIGNGVIVPWCESTSPTGSIVSPNYSEKLCHWIPWRDFDLDDVKSHQLNLLEPHFSGTETLLIGAYTVTHVTPAMPNQPTSPSRAVSNTGSCLQVCEECKPSCEELVDMKNMMRRDGALREPRTFDPRRYKDSHAFQIQGSAMGFVSLSNTVTYKRRVGQTMKARLLERWRNGLRNPVELESWSGLEISLCTRNARRRRLLNILNSQTIRRYLGSVSFEWINLECKLAYFRSLVSPAAFRQFWKANPSYRPCVGKAISICLDALQETGSNGPDHSLAALWVENFEEGPVSIDTDSTSSDEGEVASKGKSCAKGLQETQLPCHDFEVAEDWIVTFSRTKHTWTEFLSDTTTRFTMAIIDPICLECTDTNLQERRCQSREKHIGFSTLQTALQLNESILKNEGLKYENRSWDITAVKKHARFDLGDHGSLKVFVKPCLGAHLIVEWSPVKSKKWQELKDVSINEDMLGRQLNQHHQEYVRGKWDVEPLPILILSSRTTL